MNDTLNPQTLYEQLVTSARGIKKRNLELLNSICKDLYDSKATDFSLATVGRLSERAGGISKRAIYNPTSTDYQELVRAWAEFAARGKKTVSKSTEPIDDNSILLLIPDPAVRSLVGAVYAERNRLRNQVNLLKRSTSIIVDRRSGSAAKPVAVVDGAEVYDTQVGFTDSELRALEKAISSKFLEREGWEESRLGEVRNSRGRVLFDAGFTTAIRKMLAVANAR